jgi:hypothetical protein
MEIPTEEPGPRRRLPLLLLGAVVAIAAGLAVAWALLGRGGGSAAAPPAAEGGLVIDSTGGEDGRIDPAKPLRCFVQGQYVGELTLTACAQRNGVATDALDVGLDDSGSLAAAEQSSPQIIPLPPAEGEGALPPPQSADGVPDDSDPSLPVASDDSCWRHRGGRWRRVADDSDLQMCVDMLYAGRCEKPGGASYGRWGAQTLRLVAGRVEISDDNRTFRPLTIQAADCAIVPIG